MKVRTSLFLLSAIFVILIVALGLVMFHTSDLVNREVRDGDAATRIIKDVFELSIVTYEYMIHHEERMHQQWLLKYDSLGTLLERIREEEMHPEHLSRLESITSDYESLGDLFSQLQANFAKRERLIEDNEPQVEIDLSLALEQRLSAQALIGSQRMASEAFEWSAIAQQRISRVQQRTNWIALFSIIGFAILSFCVSFLTTRAITGPLDKLVKGAEIIGKGNLKHRVDIKTRNEIGELAAAFNQMTERRQQAEEELASSEEFLNSVIEQSPVSLWISDSEGILIKMNQSYRELFGATDEEAVGKYSLFKDNLIEEQGFMPLVENVFEKGEIARFTIDYDLPRVGHVKVNGAMHRILDVIVSPIEDMHGKVTNAMVQHKDITERKRAEDKLKQTLDQLERSNRELAQFAYVASHDLQEPLRMVASYVQLLEQRYKGQLDEDADEFIAYAVEGATRMQALINALLTYSRVETAAGGFEATDCEAVFDRALHDLQAAIEDSGADITHEALPTVVAEPSQLVQLFQNLVGNAIKFRSEAPPRVHVSAEQKGNEWVFSVRDNGIGIDPQYHDRIFVIFQRLHRRQEYPGAGIGLAICKRIVDRHGGRIWVESQPGEGSTFHFTIPIRR